MFTLVKEQIRLIAIDGWVGSLTQVDLGLGTPEIDVIVSCCIQILDSVLESMIMVILWG